MRARLRCTDGGWVPPYSAGLGLLYYCIIIVCLFKNIFSFHLIPLSIFISASSFGKGGRSNLRAAAAKSVPRTPSRDSGFIHASVMQLGCVCWIRPAPVPSPTRTCSRMGDMAYVSCHPNSKRINVQQTQEELDQAACPGATTW